MKSICAIEGVEAAGTKEGKFGLALVRAEGTAAGVFTSNLVRAAPIELMMDRIRSGRLSGVIVNSGCANAHTGRRGLEDAASMAAIGARALGVDEREVGVASTGVIGRYLDLPLIERQAGTVAGTLAHSAEAETAAARAIMTTDLVEKHALVRGDGTITRESADEALSLLGIDRLGLDDLDRRILTTIVREFDGGPVGVRTIAIAVGEEVRTIEEVYEPYLIRIGFIKRTPQGREATRVAAEHLAGTSAGRT